MGATAYTLQMLAGEKIGSHVPYSKILGHALSFLLVFRANSSYGRYWDGRLKCARFFARLRNMVMQACVLYKGGVGQQAWSYRHGEDGFPLTRKCGMEDDDDHRASAARTDLVRWSLALAVSLHVHTLMHGDGYYAGSIDAEVKWQLNWARMRLRTLMLPAEFTVVDRALAVEDSDEEQRLLWESDLGRPYAFHTDAGKGQGRDSYGVSLEPSHSQMMVILSLMHQSVYIHVNEPYSYKERFF